jgi:hypothetical protein
MPSCTGKGKFTLYQTMKTQRGEGIKLYSFPNLGAKWGWVVTVTLRPQCPRERDPAPLLQEAGWIPGTVRTGAENLAPTRIRSPDRQARSQ